MYLGRGSRLIMIGDSITDCDRDRTARPAGFCSYGDGYVNLVNAMLTGLAPQEQIMVINKGIGGNRITDLKMRWQEDVLNLNPDWVSIMIGINDVWCHYHGVTAQYKQVEIDEFQKIYEELIAQTFEKVRGMVIMSPFMLEPNKGDPMRKMMDDYGTVSREVAEKNNLLFIDTQKYMDNYVQSLSSYVISDDRIHLRTGGHMIIAKAFMDKIGFKW